MSGFIENNINRGTKKSAEQELVPLEELSDTEIIKACIAKDKPKAVSCFLLSEFTGNNLSDAGNPDMYKEISSRMISNALIDIEPHAEFVRVRMKFRSAIDPELKLIWSILENYGKLDSALNPDRYPFLNLSIMPNDYVGRVMLTLLNPVIWTLEPEVVGVSINNVVHIIFKTDNFFITDGEEMNIDTKNIEAEFLRKANTKYIEHNKE